MQSVYAPPAGQLWAAPRRPPPRPLPPPPPEAATQPPPAKPGPKAPPPPLRGQPLAANQFVKANLGDMLCGLKRPGTSFLKVLCQHSTQKRQIGGAPNPGGVVPAFRSKRFLEINAYRATLKLPNSFLPGDGQTVEGAGWGRDLNYAKEMAAEQVLIKLLMQNPQQVRLLDKDWRVTVVDLRARIVARTGVAGAQPPQGPLPGQPLAASLRPPPSFGSGFLDEKEFARRRLIAEIIQSQGGLANPAQLRMVGRRLHQELDRLWAPGTLRQWLEGQEGFEVVPVPFTKLWFYQFAPGHEPCQLEPVPIPHSDDTAAQGHGGPAASSNPNATFAQGHTAASSKAYESPASSSTAYEFPAIGGADLAKPTPAPGLSESPRQGSICVDAAEFERWEDASMEDFKQEVPLCPIMFCPSDRVVDALAHWQTFGDAASAASSGTQPLAAGPTLEERDLFFQAWGPGPYPENLGPQCPGLPPHLIIPVPVRVRRKKAAHEETPPPRRRATLSPSYLAHLRDTQILTATTVQESQPLAGGVPAMASDVAESSPPRCAPESSTGGPAMASESESDEAMAPAETGQPTKTQKWRAPFF